MDPIKLKSHVFDAEQALTWARQAIEEEDTEAIREALAATSAAVTAARDELAKAD